MEKIIQVIKGLRYNNEDDTTTGRYLTGLTKKTGSVLVKIQSAHLRAVKSN